MPRRGLLLLLGLCALALLSGCQMVGLATLGAANDIAKLGAYQRTADVAYGPRPRQKLDVYTPEGRYLPDDHGPILVKGPKQDETDLASQTVAAGRSASVQAGQPTSGLTADLPVVVYFHGGDWTDGYPAKNAHRFVADALTSRGFVAVIVNYRRYPNVKFPAFVHDGALSVAWVYRHIQDYGGDPNQIFIMGHSAGAHIGSLVTLDNDYLRQAGVSPNIVQGFIGLAGPYSFLVPKDDPLHEMMPDDPKFKKMFGPPKRYPRSQPVNYVQDDEPPMLLISGGLDHRVPTECMNRLARRLRKHHDSVQTIIYKHLDHILLIGSLATPVRWTEPVIDDVAAFIRNHLQPKPMDHTPRFASGNRTK